MPFAIRAVVVFGKNRGELDLPDWHMKFEETTGMSSDADSLAQAGTTEDGKYDILYFHLIGEKGLVTYDSQDVAQAAIAELMADLSGIRPKPVMTLSTTRGTKITEAQSNQMWEVLRREGSSPEQFEVVLAELGEIQVVIPAGERDEKPKRTRAGRPARFRNLSSPREWLDYIPPGETVPLYESLGLSNVPDSETVNEELWREMYRVWYNQTEKRKRSQRTYNKGDGRKVQSRWEKTEKGKKTRAKYFEGTEGIKARANSQARTKARLRLGKALKDPEYEPDKWSQTVNDPERGGTGQRWIDVIRSSKERFGEDITIDEIERIFWEQGLRPMLKTLEDFEESIRGLDLPRINPKTGAELV